jgi:hypothetical protein
MAFRVFDALGIALVEMEKRETHISSTPRVWPSEASAELFDKTEAGSAGKCRRYVYFRMTGREPSNPMDALGCQIVRLGRAVETEVIAQAKAAGLHVASGVRHFVEDLTMPMELDGVLLDPATHQGVITEVKSFDGYVATKRIVKEGKPKLEHVLQSLIYLNEFRTGRVLKQAIEQRLAEREQYPEDAERRRNRIEVTRENLDLMDPGPLATKLLYFSRTGRDVREFDISIYEDFDGAHYPAIDGTPWKLFTVGNIYNRYTEVQGYWRRAVEAAKQSLESRWITQPLVLKQEDGAPVPERENALDEYWEAVQQEIAKLPDEFLPLTDFEYRYSAEKIETLHKQGSIGKTKYADWKKKGAILGAWQCVYCAYKNICVAKTYPDLRFLLLNGAVPVEELVMEKV